MSTLASITANDDRSELAANINQPELATNINLSLAGTTLAGTTVPSTIVSPSTPASPGSLQAGNLPLVRKGDLITAELMNAVIATILAITQKLAVIEQRLDALGSGKSTEKTSSEKTIEKLKETEKAVEKIATEKTAEKIKETDKTVTEKIAEKTAEKIKETDKTITEKIAEKTAEKAKETDKTSEKVAEKTVEKAKETDKTVIEKTTTEKTVEKAKETDKVSDKVKETEGGIGTILPGPATIVQPVVDADTVTDQPAGGRAFISTDERPSVETPTSDQPGPVEEPQDPS